MATTLARLWVPWEERGQGDPAHVTEISGLQCRYPGACGNSGQRPGVCPSCSWGGTTPHADEPPVRVPLARGTTCHSLPSSPSAAQEHKAPVGSVPGARVPPGLGEALPGLFGWSRHLTFSSSHFLRQERKKTSGIHFRGVACFTQSLCHDCFPAHDPPKTR